jgi:hypothetical protein
MFAGLNLQVFSTFSLVCRLLNYECRYQCWVLIMLSNSLLNLLPTRRLLSISLSGVLATGLALAQDSAGNGPLNDPAGSQNISVARGWPRADEQSADPAANSNPEPVPANGGMQPGYSNGPNSGPSPSGYPNNPNYGPGPNYAPPAQLTIQPGTFVTVRVNQTLSSDRNQPGDAFSATLVNPVVVNGLVVAQPGQTLGGRVTEAQKAGRVEGTSRLAIQLTDLTLADGQQVPIQSQFVSRNGGTSVGRDAGAIAGTTGAGAAIGAAADWGRGAAIGAGAGAAAGIIGVLLTRGHASVIYPESVLTFRIEAPVAVATDRAPEAFRPVQPLDYRGAAGAPPVTAYTPTPAAPVCGGYACPPPAPVYNYGPPAPAYYYGPSYYPYWSPGFSFFVGPRYYYGPRFYAYRPYGYRGFRR